MLHELTHAFQLEPQGIGPYGGPNKAVWELIEGMADAVLVSAGGFPGEQDRPKGGSYHDGYRYIGYFFDWVRRNKDKNFIRKMNKSCTIADRLMIANLAHLILEGGTVSGCVASETCAVVVNRAVGQIEQLRDFSAVVNAQLD